MNRLCCQKAGISGVVIFIVLLFVAGCATTEDKPAAKPAPVQKEVKKSPPPTPKKTDDDELEVSPIAIAEKPSVTALPVEPPAPASEHALPTDPNTFLVERRTKDKSHPFYGTGHKMGFAVNGQMGRWIVLERGKTYTFQVRTDVKHDFYFSKSAVGWGGAAFTKGVEGQFTFNGDVTLNVNKETPDVLYYQCRNHKSMGGKLVIIDAGSDLAAAQAKLDKEREAYIAKQVASAKQKNTLSPAKVKQKVSYAGMLIQFKGKKLDAARKAELQKMIDDAKAAQAAGDLEKAMKMALYVVDAFKKQPKQALSEEEIAELRGEYEGILASVHSFQESHDAAKRGAKKEKRKVVEYDQKEVAKLLAEADTLAKNNKFKQAMKKARQAEHKIAQAMNDMLGSRTLVYELKFDTPKDEFEYEVKRYESYLELIPVAMEVKKPRKSSVDLMQKYVDKGKFYHDKAHESAKSDKWKEAIVVIKDATKEVRRGLMLLGVSM